MALPRARFDVSDPGLAAWATGVSYQPSDTVIYNGSVWICLAANSGVIPGTNSLDWTELVQQEVLAAISAPLTAITNAETVVVKAAIQAGVQLTVGTKVRFTIEGVATSSNADNVTFAARAGTLGTTGDQLLGTAVVAAAGSGSGIAFKAVFEFTVETLGATGTGQGGLLLTNTGITGIAAAAVTEKIVALTNLATTTATFVELTLVTAAATTSVTVDDASVEVIPAGSVG